VMAIPMAVEQLTYGFTDMTDKGAVLNLWWDKVNATIPITLGTS
jgi:hypothetical protein